MKYDARKDYKRHYFLIISFKLNKTSMTKRHYEKPSVEVVVLNQQQQLLAVSGGTTFSATRGDDYGDETEW